MGSIRNINNAVTGGNLIDVKNLSFTYQGMEAPALKNINMVVQEGQCVLLCGKSGCGNDVCTEFPEEFGIRADCTFVVGDDCGCSRLFRI